MSVGIYSCPSSKELTMLKQILINHSRINRLRVWGFTLIELLVALLVSTVIISVLLTFTVQLLTANRNEEAKTATQDEIAAALNYIAGDLQEAVFIYGARALELNHSNTGESGIADQIPYGSTNPAPGVEKQAKNVNIRPILVFWKRSGFGPRDTLRLDNTKPSGGANQKEVRCLGSTAKTGNTCYGQGRFLYSLVVYYLIKDTNDNWSDAARIGRWEIRDGVQCEDSAKCTSTVEWQYINPDNPLDTSKTIYEIPPSPGFRLFSLSGSGSIPEKMSRWRKWNGGSEVDYNLNVNPINILIDHVDDTPYTTQNDDRVSGAPEINSAVELAVGTNNTANYPDTANYPEFPPLNSPAEKKPNYKSPLNPDCDSPERGVGVPDAGTPEQAAFAERVPTVFGGTNFAGGFGSPTNENSAYRMTSFYACVVNYGTPNQTLARIWIRGNPRSRYLTRPFRSLAGISDPLDTDLVTSDIRVLGRGLFNLPE
jgi:type II secretory pathway pseudopilin PulG